MLALLPVRADVCHKASLPQEQGGEPVVTAKNDEQDFRRGATPAVSTVLLRTYARWVPLGCQLV